MVSRGRYGRYSAEDFAIDHHGGTGIRCSLTIRNIGTGDPKTRGRCPGRGIEGCVPGAAKEKRFSIRKKERGAEFEAKRVIKVDREIAVGDPGIRRGEIAFRLYSEWIN